MQTFLKDCRWGRFILLRGAMISTYADVYGEWCELEVSLYRRLLKPDSVVIEVGANLGLHTVPLAKIARSGRDICFEPQRVIFNVLCGNLAVNNLNNFGVHRVVVGEHEEVTTIESTDYDIPWNYGAFSVAAGFSGEAHFPGVLTLEPTTCQRRRSDPAYPWPRLRLRLVLHRALPLRHLQRRRSIVAGREQRCLVEPLWGRHQHGVLPRRLLANQ